DQVGAGPAPANAPTSPAAPPLLPATEKPGSHQTDLNLRLALAWRYHGANDYAQAESLCRQILATNPENGEAWRLVGEACLFQGKCPEAAAGFQQALRLGPNPAEVHNNLGVALAQQGKPSEAISSYRQALQLKPDYVEASNNLAVSLMGQGQLDEAVVQL